MYYRPRPVKGEETFGNEGSRCVSCFGTKLSFVLSNVCMNYVCMCRSRLIFFLRNKLLLFFFYYILIMVIFLNELSKKFFEFEIEFGD